MGKIRLSLLYLVAFSLVLLWVLFRCDPVRP
jgi:hypothetical protein